MSLVFAAIAPHGGLAINAICEPEEVGVARSTQEGMAELGRRFDRARPEATVVLTPHNVHVEGSFAVVLAATSVGDLGNGVALEVPGDIDLAATFLDELRIAGIPTAAVSFGGNDPGAAAMPMDWGTLIPLWFMGGRSDPPVPVVIVSPSRDRPLEEHVRAGDVLRRVIDRAAKRVAVIASADHGHAHDAEGPYGFDPAAVEYDERIVELVRGGRLDRLPELGTLAEPAKADSLWQLLILDGVLAPGARAELLSYEAPTYFGMLCASYEPGA